MLVFRVAVKKKHKNHTLSQSLSYLEEGRKLYSYLSLCGHTLYRLLLFNFDFCAFLNNYWVTFSEFWVCSCQIRGSVIAYQNIKGNCD